jgi:hypothetical protein
MNPRGGDQGERFASRSERSGSTSIDVALRAAFELTRIQRR